MGRGYILLLQYIYYCSTKDTHTHIVLLSGSKCRADESEKGTSVWHPCLSRRDLALVQVFICSLSLTWHIMPYRVISHPRVTIQWSIYELPARYPFACNCAWINRRQWETRWKQPSRSLSVRRIRIKVPGQMALQVKVRAYTWLCVATTSQREKK